MLKNSIFWCVICRRCHTDKTNNQFSISYRYKEKPIYRRTCKACSSKIILQKYPINKNIKKYIADLHDTYIIQRLQKSGLPVTPEMIELKRQLIKLKRLCQKHSAT